MKEIKGLKSRCITEDNDKEVCPVCGEKLAMERGIEVGQIFKLKTKYSKPLILFT